MADADENQTPTTDDNKKKSFLDSLSTTQKVVGGAAVLGVVGTVLYFATKKKEEKTADASTSTTKPDTTPTPPVAEEIEPIYSAAPALAMDPNKLPVLRRGTATAPGQTYWILGDGTVGDFATAFDAGMTDNQPVAGQSTPGSNNFIADLGPQVQLQGTSGMPAADVWIAVLGKDQAKYSVGALKEILTKTRPRLGNQRIIWVLAKSAPSEIAKALGEAGEEWFRSSYDLPASIAIDAIKAVQVDGVDSANAAFPPPVVPGNGNA